MELKPKEVEKEILHHEANLDLTPLINACVVQPALES
jgi:hypothetical protein